MADLAPPKIQFGTKAATLQAIRAHLRCSTVGESVVFSVDAWRRDQGSLLAQIRRSFLPKAVIVRSSALAEDGENNSMAGAFVSVSNVPSTSEAALIAAIEEVLASYGSDESDANEVLVQEMVADVSMSGVVFSHDLNTGAPYYVINYDDISGRTDTVTSGQTDTSRTLLVHRHYSDQVQSPRFRALLQAVQEIEALVASSGVDLEFAVTKDEVIYIFQVRRIAVQQNWNRDITQHISAALGEISQLIERRFRPQAGVWGQRTVFAEMTDWNPAEMIGTVPRPLARSLYEFLITDSIWAEARAEMGYKDCSGRPLMVNLGGRVFIDVRESLNSFLPAELPAAVGEKMVDAWLERLADNPELHDKVEFEVALTIFGVDFERRIAPYASCLSAEEVATFREYSRQFTNGLLDDAAMLLPRQFDRLKQLEARRTDLLASQPAMAPIDLVRVLLLDCRNFGTRSFSVLARYAFIAEDFLRSFVHSGALSAERAAAFRSSITTVLTEFLHLLQDCQRGDADWPCFLARYGHLRPGTYDILAHRYDQHAENKDLSGAGGSAGQRHDHAFALTDDEVLAIRRVLAEVGLAVDVDVLFTLMREAIAGREYGKLVFTRNISDALESIAQWGIEVGLSRDELSYLPIAQILASATTAFHQDYESHYREIAATNRRAYEISKALRLPYLLARPSDIYVVPLLKSRANFITGKRIQAAVQYISDHAFQSSRTSGKVVLIERADPGYDWIFLSPIAGLVTKYGGSNSHMAIRCAELNIPAAIGCGEQMFDQLKRSSSVLLDCGAAMLAPIR